MGSLRTFVAFTAALVAGLGSVSAQAAGAPAHKIDYGEVLHVGDDAARNWTTRQPVATAVQVQLQAENVGEAETARTLAAIDRRAVAELRKFAMTLEGKNVTADELSVILAARERIIRFDVQSSPRAYAAGRPLPYVVTDAEASRLGRGLAATWIERQGPLREKVKELVTLEDISGEDVPAVQAWSRRLAIDHAREALAGMRGAGFFSADDAQRFLDEVFDEKIDEIRIEKLADPVSRAGFLEDARAHFATSGDDTTLGLNLARDAQRPALAARRASSATRAGLARD